MSKKSKAMNNRGVGKVVKTTISEPQKMVQALQKQRKKQPVESFTNLMNTDI